MWSSVCQKCITYILEFTLCANKVAQRTTLIGAYSYLFVKFVLIIKRNAQSKLWNMRVPIGWGFVKKKLSTSVLIAFGWHEQG